MRAAAGWRRVAPMVPGRRWRGHPTDDVGRPRQATWSHPAPPSGLEAVAGPGKPVFFGGFGVPSRLVSQTEIPTLHPRGLRLPPQLEGLSRLAFNLYWSWHPEVRSLFARIDRATYQRHRNPVPVLQTPRDWSTLLDETAQLVMPR